MDWEQVAFAGANGVTIRGTLTRPAGAGTHPAVLLIQGSGPTDRDGNQGETLRTDLLRELADALAAAGIASLRCDKRGLHANAAELPTSSEAMAEFYTWELAEEDWRCAFAFLSAQPDIDANRVGIIGHSEGGMVALRLAQSERPAALALLATAARPLAAVVTEQLSALLDRQGAQGEQRAALMAHLAGVLALLEREGRTPDDLHPGLAVLFPAYLNRYWQSALRLDPLALLAHYNGPVLVVNGSDDPQVSAERDARVLAEALQRRGGAWQLVVAEGAGHALKRSRPDGLPEAEPINADSLAAIRDWMTTHLGAA